MIVPAEAVLALRRKELETAQRWSDLFAILAIVPSREDTNEVYDLLQLALELEYVLTDDALILGPLVESLETKEITPEEEREAIERGRALLCRLQGVRPPERGAR